MRSAFSVIFFFLPLVSAMTFTIPSNITSGASTTITWTPAASDPSSFSIELVNTNFHNSFALANNVQTSDETITITIPIVPAGDGYTVEGVNIGDINTVYGTSGDFSIAATQTSSTSSSSTSNSQSSGSLTSPTGSTTGSGVSATSTQPSASSGTSSGASSSASPSAFNGNGAPGSNIGSGIGGSIAAAVVGVIAGAVFV